MIRIEHLFKRYNSFDLNIDKLDIHSGELFGIVGKNGAGKTTLFRLLLDLIKADKGIIFSANMDVSISEDWKNYTASYIDESFLIDFLTPEEFFFFIGDIYNYTKEQVRSKVEKYAGFLNNEILGQGKKYIREFSSGNKQKIGIISCLISNPIVLILDEPFNHLDPTSQFQLKRILSDLREKNQCTILISSHDLKHLTDICTRIILMDQGSILKDIQKDVQTLNQLEEFFSIV